MLIATVDVLPGKSYEIVGYCTAVESSLRGRSEFEKVVAELVKQAQGKGANGLIGLTFAPSVGNNNQMVLVGFGTAIRIA